ncbi:DnaJ sub C member 21 [Sparganum proliferum]
MRCFYEVLGLERTCEASELKKAYYKASLEWHPDKNHDRLEEATARFQEIQEAYRVLSDIQERAWYDRHREEILRGGQGGIGGDYKDDSLDVFQFFSRSCFAGFDDGPKGFYTVYREVFDDIAKEERRGGDWTASASEDESSDAEEEGKEGRDVAERTAARGRQPSSFPPFGHADSDYDSVVRPFYAFWEAFSSRRSYAWAEKYDTRRLNSRAERRAAEAENRKLREAARRKRSEEVRQLVAYVMRRDKRIDVERERLAEAAIAASNRARENANKARERNVNELQAAWREELATGSLASQWAEEMEAELARIEAELEGKKRPTTNGRLANTVSQNSSRSGPEAGQSLVTEEEEGEDSEEEEEDDEEDDVLQCIACDKTFASLAAKRNHEASKKHKKQVALLRSVLLEEDAVAELTAAGIPLEDSEPEPEEKASIKLTKRAKKARRRQLREPVAAGVGEEKEKKGESVDDTSCQQVPVDAGESEDVEAVKAPGSKAAKNGHPAKGHQSVPQESFVCMVCSQEFPSKNKLFAHIKEANHAMLKVVVPGEVGKEVEEVMPAAAGVSSILQDTVIGQELDADSASLDRSSVKRAHMYTTPHWTFPSPLSIEIHPPPQPVSQGNPTDFSTHWD